MGTTAVTYGPAEKLKASQISLFLVRVYEKAGNSCDVPGDGLERAVACPAALRVIPSLVEGSSFATVARDQMAVYMIGLWHNMVVRGLPPQPPRKPAEGTYTAVSAGSYLSCGLRTDGTVRCWGQKEYGQVKVPGGEFSAVSAGGYHSCGLRSDGNVECWGRNNYGQVDVPGGLFSAVSAGGEHSCGLRTDKTIECWGWNKSGQVNAPSGRFSAVSAGRFHTCALRTDRTIRCWGNNRFGEVDTPGG